MIRVEEIEVAGFETAVRAARNPMSSWEKSDSDYEVANLCDHDFHIGDADMGLLQRLYKAGVEHRTYARMIYVWMDVTAPLYLLKELDRYSVGKSQVSTSTMHKIHAKEFTLDDFSHEHLLDDGMSLLNRIIDELNAWRYIYLNGSAWCEPKDKRAWWQMIQLLPSSYNQKRTICMSYEVVFKIIKERTGHKLDEWNEFVEILRDLPYVKEMMGETE